MIRRQQRLRREYLLRKSLEEQKRIITEKKQTVKKSLEGNCIYIDTTLKYIVNL